MESGEGIDSGETEIAKVVIEIGELVIEIELRGRRRHPLEVAVAGENRQRRQRFLGRSQNVDGKKTENVNSRRENREGKGNESSSLWGINRRSQCA